MYLDIKKLSYVSETNKLLLDEIDFSANIGELIIFFGNSDEKTLLIKLMIGLMDFNTGSISYDSKLLSKMGLREKMKLRSRIGYVPKTSALMPNMTIYDNLALPLEYHTKLGKTQVYKIVSEYLERVNLASAHNKHPHNLRLSDIRLVDFIRAIILNPEIVYIDNILNDLNDSDFISFDAVISEKIKAGITFIISAQKNSRLPSFEMKRTFTLSNGILTPAN